MLISCIPLGEFFWNFYYMFSSQHTTRSHGYICQKKFFSQNLVLILDMAIMEDFWWEYSHGLLGVNQK